MLPHLRKNLFFLPSRCSSSSSSQVQVRTLLIRFQVREFSSSPFLPPPPCKRVGEDDYKVRVSVLWDFNTCPVPSQVSYLKVPPSIIGAVRTNGFMGPIQIEAYGNVYQLTDINQELLFLNGVDLHHIPGEKNGSHRYLKDWISMNPPPAHLFLITGNRDPDFVCTVRHLSLNNYKILFACPERADDYLYSASTTTLEWSSIVEGKYLIGKDFKIDNDTDRSEDVRPEILEIKTTSQNPSSCNEENNDIANCEFEKAENKHENPSRKQVDEICRSPYSSPVDNPLVEEKRHDKSAETYIKSSTFFNWISSWWTFWKSSPKSDELTANPDQDVIHSRKPELFDDSKLAKVDPIVSHFEEPKSSELQQDDSYLGMHELFSIGSFWWDVVESYLFTPRGSHLLSKSRSREDLALRLQKDGPPFLRCLT